MKADSELKFKFHTLVSALGLSQDLYTVKGIKVEVSKTHASPQENLFGTQK